MIVKNSGYSEGSASIEKNRLKTWHPRKLSPVSDINLNLSTLRNRSSSLAINTPIGSAVIETMSLYVIGSGLKLSPKIDSEVLGLSQSEARNWEEKTRREWEIYSNSVNVDFYRRNNFKDLQQIAFTNMLIDGDTFVLYRRVSPESIRNPYTLKLQIIEGNRVSNPNQSEMYTGNIVINPNNGNRIIDGVEIDRYGRLKAYWISSGVPSDITEQAYNKIEWERVEAYGEETGSRNILQICRDVRPGQTRGVPFMSPVIETIKQISRYVDAELDSAITRSFYSLFFTQFTQPTQFDLNQLSNEDREPIDTTGFTLSPGTVTSLPMGVDVKAIDSSKQSAFPAFIIELMKQIGASIGISYEVLLHHFSSSYSASRAALLQSWDNFKRWRTIFVRDFCQPIYEQFLIEAIAHGRIKADRFFSDPIYRQAWSKADWYGTSMSVLDPKKEMEATKLKLELGLTTHEKEAAELTGTNYFDNIDQLTHEGARENE